MNVYERRRGRDRLRDLPNDNILRILSFVGTKQAVQASALSRRWRYIWTSLPCLNFLSEEFSTQREFSKFVRHVMARRDDTLDVFSLKLTFCRKIVSQEIMEQILRYAISYNLQQLNITSLNEETFELNPSLLSCQSLTHLTLDGYDYQLNRRPLTVSSWDLPALETLNLYHFTVCDHRVSCLFSRLAKLKNLVLKNCKLQCPGFNIRHDGLSSLTLEEGRKSRGTRVNVETPQLENLTIRNWPDIRLVSTPNLSSLHYIDYDNGIRLVPSHFLSEDPCDYCGDYDCICDNDPCKDCGGYDCECDRSDDDYYEGVYPLQINCELDNLEKVDICIDPRTDKKEDTYKLISMLTKLLPPVRFVTLNLELVKLLTPYLEFARRLPFYNLESVKLYPLNLSEIQFKKVEVPPTFENFLLEGFPSATLSTVSHEETIAMNNLTLARNLIPELQVALEEWRKELSVKPELEQKPASLGNLFLELALDRRRKFHKQHRARSLLLMLYLALSRVPASSDRAKLKAAYNTLLDEVVALLERKQTDSA